MMVTQGARRGGRGRQGLGGPCVAPGGPRAAATPELNLSEPSLTRGGQRPGTEGEGCPAHLRSLRRGWTWGGARAGVSPGLGCPPACCPGPGGTPRETPSVLSSCCSLISPGGIQLCCKTMRTVVL